MKIRTYSDREKSSWKTVQRSDTVQIGFITQECYNL